MSVLGALHAGVLAIMRRAWELTIVASIISFFLALLFGLFCGVIQAFVAVEAMILLILSRDEFRRGHGWGMAGLRGIAQAAFRRR